MYKVIKLIILFLLFSNLGIAQTGGLKILVLDSIDNMPMSFVIVKIEKEGRQSKSVIDSFMTGKKGQIRIRHIDTGKYLVKVTFDGLFEPKQQEIVINLNTETKVTMNLIMIPNQNND